MSRNSVTIAAGIKLGIFTVVSILVTGLLAAIMGNIGFGAGKTYQAEFTSASMLEKGDDVRIAGVSVGEVKDVEHHDRNHALVTFRVKADVPMTTSTRAEIRFKNLVGDRYLAIEEGKDGDAPRLDEDSTIPLSRTSPALDLTVLFNGFQPLFTALNPTQVNDLSLNLVRVLQGEGGTVQSLLANTASLTNSLADRDKLIGEVITNLSQTADTVNNRSEQFTELIVELKGWMTDLAKDRKTIGSSLDNISDLTEVVAGLLKDSRPWLKADVVELRKLAELLTRPESEKVLGELLDRLPESMTDQTRTGTYGSWYNYYLCAASVRIQLPVLSDVPGLAKLQEQLGNFKIKSNAARCQ
ncbi:MCE family protein [Nocardioides sp. Soil796]|uniref:MCE family protein n=1 Tax=Nocardioides sp. Soil796 TaxID=1736412 RepID=UPI00070C4C0B|nr:MCE family protein [Nocardioides sp. Soil796]KRF16157.1 virulence factor Mce [Nocardioides sp. Soil796]